MGRDDLALNPGDALQTLLPQGSGGPTSMQPEIRKASKVPLLLLGGINKYQFRVKRYPFWILFFNCLESKQSTKEYLTSKNCKFC